MTERKFVVLNTSIQTGSNANRLIRDDDGNVRAELELQLPDNIFSPNAGGLKLDSVSMLTTKFRTSMMETPIASLPVEDENTNEQVYISPCKLDVYPFSLTDGGKIEPYDDCPNGDKSFESYKFHYLTIKFWSNINGDRTLLYTTDGTSNTFGNMISLSNPLSLWFVKYNLFDKICNHAMNLAIPKTQSFIKIDGDQLYIKNIGTLEQILASALANAMTYASTEIETEVNIDLLPPQFSETAEPPPLFTDVVNFNGVDWVFWKYSTSSNVVNMNNSSGIHPKVTINENSLSISYDTSAFGSVVPVLWNTSFIENYDMPVQLSLDELLSSLGYQPPPKRYYKYGLYETRTSYNFSLLSNIKAAVFNIIANKAMKDTFSFLPWINFPERNYVESKQIYQETHRDMIHDLTSYGGRVTLKDEYRTQTFMMIAYRFNYVKRTTENVPALYQPYLQFFPDDKDYVMYYYELDDGITVDKPENRKNQLLYLGTFSSQPFAFQIRSATFNSGYASPVRENPEYIDVHSVIETENPSYPVGITVTSEDETAPTVSVGNPYSPSEMFIYGSRLSNLDQLNPKANIQFLQSSGTWQEGNEIYNDVNELAAGSGINLVPMFNCTHFIFLPEQTGDPTVRILQLFDKDAVSFGPTYRLYQVKTQDVDIKFEISPLIQTKSHIRSEVDVQLLRQEVPDENDLAIIPNIYEGEHDSLFILDASSVTVDIGEIEPIVTAPTFNIETSSSELRTFTVDRKVVYSNSLDSNVATYTWCDYTAGVGLAGIINPTQEIYFNRQGVRIGPECRCLVRFVVCTNFERYGPYNCCIRVPDENIINDCWCIARHFRRERSEDKPITDYIIDEPPASKPDEHSDPTTTTEISHDASLVEGTTTTDELIGEETSSGITGRVPYTKYDYYADGHFTYFTCDMDGEPIKIETKIIANPHYDYLFNLASLIPYVKDDILDNVIVLNSRPEIWPSETETEYYSSSNWTLFLPSPNYYLVAQFVVLETPVSPNPFQYQFLGGGLRSYNNSVIPVTYDEILTKTYKETTTTISRVAGTGGGNVRLTFSWKDLPIVVMSPIQSIVMTVSGMQMTQEIQPINMTEIGGASLVSTIPIIENYYSLAQTLRDLHDELVVTKDSFEDAAVYKLATTSGTERILTFNVKYITKDGKLHQLYIPENGVFILQLTFGLSYYIA